MNLDKQSMTLLTTGNMSTKMKVKFKYNAVHALIYLKKNISSINLQGECI